ncbi:alpha-beta hydrolase superfamily lysophospholipase [Oceanihabitans sediminis]|uniref:Alpha/beta hydrolase n=1 Tax=Oceanihabitans sediminis TaxID=1812012 RepID=A0A368P414_9FLAO|nr:alpha/beta hydrolase [Oceanihabitans sediminis]RBP28448.1 alpha-beta hydrolase superfamily lysophospholipase [Oceanihabitans sediminis]RCU56645.1 alpha/beta hydrolase [Oceanihabitans sediminis]
MDLEKDYSSQVLSLPPDYEGEVQAVLVASNYNTGNRKSILFVHGYVDYFFQAHLGEQFHRADFDFYALDLRKYGRALLKHQHPNYCKSIDEYFEEISMALRQIKSSSNSVFLMGHSTGGLTASCYMNYGKEKNLVSGLILNAPFLDFNKTKIDKSISIFFAKLIASVSDYAKIDGVLSPAYAQSIHKDYYGEWDFNLAWKPIKGFSTYFKWVVAIARAQKRLEKSDIQVPVLVMHSSRSIKISKFTKEAMYHDIVLNIEDIQRVGEKLGNKVTLIQIDDAVHDIFLSPKAVREEAFKKMFSWLDTSKF